MCPWKRGKSTDQAALPIPKEGPGMFAGVRFEEVVHHGLGIFERSGRISPQVGTVRRRISFSYRYFRLTRIDREHVLRAVNGPGGCAIPTSNTCAVQARGIQPSQKALDDLELELCLVLLHETP